MKRKGWKISIFMLLISFCAFGFVLLPKNTIKVSAANVGENCYYLIGENGTPYLSNTIVGSVDGTGEFIVGHEDVKLNAMANSNFQIVGWQITLEEQEVDPIFVDASGLSDGSKIINLTAKDDKVIPATIEFTMVNGYAKTSSFTLINVFEKMIVRPVFDNIYYHVDISNLIDVSSHEQFCEISNAEIYNSGDGEDDDSLIDQQIFKHEILFYEDAVESDGKITYSNAYIKTILKHYRNESFYGESVESCYYYGNLLTDGTAFYTIHNTLENVPKEEKVDYSVGAFRFNDSVSIAFDVDIDTTDIKKSKNIDLNDVKVVGNYELDLDLFDASAPSSSNFKITQDSYKRTTNYEINFNIINSSKYVNGIKLDYHNLYVVDVNVLLEGSDEHEELKDILGTQTVTSNQSIGNISFYNFYSITSDDGLQFLVKNSQDNGSKSFGITCVDSVSKTIEGKTYVYYSFDKLNGTTNKSQYFSSISENVDVNIEFTSSSFLIEFEVVEYIVADNSQVVLNSMSGNSLPAIYKKRGETLSLDETSVQDVENIGYKFKGYATSKTGSVASTISYTVDKDKPSGTKILLCYEKIEYSVKFINYNKISLGSNNPISSVSFGLSSGIIQFVETFRSEDLTETSKTLANKVKIGSNISISTKVNSGFIVRYSLISPEEIQKFKNLGMTDEELANCFISNTTLSSSVLKNVNFSKYTHDDGSWETSWAELYVYDIETQKYVLNENKTYDLNEIYYYKEIKNEIYLYAYEEYVKYSLTYYTEKLYDTNVNDDVIMADIDVETTAVVQIIMYELNSLGEYIEIKPENNNLTALVAKIVVSDLKYGDKVILKSAGIQVKGYQTYEYTTDEDWNLNWENLFTKNGEEYIANTSSTYNNQTTYYKYDVAYTYSFNWFTEDDKATLSVIEGTTNHEEEVLKSREIKVVYSMPNTKIFVTVDEEFASIKEFYYSITIEQNGKTILPEVKYDVYEYTTDEDWNLNWEILFIKNGEEYIANTSPTYDNTLTYYVYKKTNSFIVDISSSILVTISDIADCYQFIGYVSPKSEQMVGVDRLYFDYSAIEGVNTLVLKFQRVSYNFYFSQHGFDFDGEYVKFDSLDYAVMNVDNINVSFEKPYTIDENGEEVKVPLGYYVATVMFGDFDGYSSYLSETNEDRDGENILLYNFMPTREQFIDLVTNYSVNNLGVNEVYVDIHYLAFTYEVAVKYSLTNPKDDDRDLQVNYSSIELVYTYNEENFKITKEYASEVLTFVNIPYGANVVINILSGVPNGLSYDGWLDFDGNVVLEKDYSSTYLKVGNVDQDSYFIYRLSYNSYKVNVIKGDNSQGSPQVFVNNKEYQIDSVQITLYDKLEIYANASRENGYQFKEIQYYVPLYSEYIYNAETWNGECLNLYILKNDIYVKNVSDVYNPTEDYYTYNEKLVRYSESDIFTDNTFEISNYAINGNELTFTIVYDLLKLTISNNIEETADEYMWKLTGRGNSNQNAKVNFDLYSMATFSMIAENNKGETRNVSSIDYVTFNDKLTIIIIINKNAINAGDGKVYDLSLGLHLDSVLINDMYKTFEDLGDGRFSIIFNVGEYLPDDSEIINIVYNLKIQAKTIDVTTIVNHYADFYSNINMFINAEKYGFESGRIEYVYDEYIDNPTVLSHDLQFLASTEVSGGFKTSYANNFEISGVMIYCDGVEVTASQYAKYGIQVLENMNVIAKMMYDVRVVYKVQPKITYNGNNGTSNYTKVYDWDIENSEGKSQTLSIGKESSFDIQVADDIAKCMIIKYLSTVANSYESDSVVDCGYYKVIIRFKDNDKFDWLKDIVIADEVTLTITPKTIKLIYDEEIEQVSKIYDGTSDWYFDRVDDYLQFIESGIVDNHSWKVAYKDILKLAGNNLKLENAKVYIAKDNKEIKNANEDEFFDLYVYNFNLKETTINNFVLKNSDLTIKNYIQIKRKMVELSGISVYDKVYDGTNKAELVSIDNIIPTNKIVTDDLSINGTALKVSFINYNVGTNKMVKVDASEALSGTSKDNYYVGEINISGLTIYPQKLTASIYGVGDVSLLNNRGLKEKDKVDLIPLNAVLSVEVIRFESSEYVNIYSNIAYYLKGNNEFAVGYKIKMIVNGSEVEIDKNLHLSIPNVKNITGLYFLTGKQTGKVNYSEDGNYLVLDLSEINVDIDTFFLTQKKILLKTWQIVLIVLSILLIVLTIILTIIIMRKRKHKEYSAHDKI